MIEHLYVRMRKRASRLINQEEALSLVNKDIPQIIEFLKPKSKYYVLFSQEYAIFYSNEDLISVMSKGRYLSPLLEFERMGDILEDNKTRILFDVYLYYYKSKILMMLLTGMYSQKSFDEIKSFILTTPSINKIIESLYNSQRVYDLSLMLLEDKKLSAHIQDDFNRKDLNSITKRIFLMLLTKIKEACQHFSTNPFIMKYFNYLLLDVGFKAKQLGVSWDKKKTKIIKKLLMIQNDESYRKKIIKEVLGKKDVVQKDKIDESILDEIEQKMYSQAQKVFLRYAFTYDALLSYILLLEREFKVVNVIAKYHLYKSRLSLDKVKEMIRGYYG